MFVWRMPYDPRAAPEFHTNSVIPAYTAQRIANRWVDLTP